MVNLGATDERLIELARAVDFARRYYARVAATRSVQPLYDISHAEIVAALQSTGRTFRFNRRERLFATREADVPGELGLNLKFNGSVEFILVARGPHGHFGQPFTLLARNLAKQRTPELIPSPPAPRPQYSDAAELRGVLAEGLELYADLAAAIRANRLLE